MRRTSFQSMPCPLARAADILGDSWNVLIIREAFYGRARFDEFQAELGIATNTLTRRLADLVEAGVLDRQLYSDKPPRYEYRLTEAGRDLRPVMLTLLAWGNKHATPKGHSVRLIDTETGDPVDLQLIDGRTGQPIGQGHQVRRRSQRSARSADSSFDGQRALEAGGH